MSDPWLLPNAQTLGWCPERRGGGTPDSLIRRLKALPPNLMVDVGALDGSDAIAYAQAGHRVWSFEPTPSKLEPIRKRFAREAARGASIRLFPYALSNESGSAGFVVNRAVAAPRMRRFVGDALGSAQDGLHAPLYGGGRERAVVNVPVRTLDGLIPSGETVFMLKVDTQVRGKLGRPYCSTCDMHISTDRAVRCAGVRLPRLAGRCTTLGRASNIACRHGILARTHARPRGRSACPRAASASPWLQMRSVQKEPEGAGESPQLRAAAVVSRPMGQSGVPSWGR